MRNHAYKDTWRLSQRDQLQIGPIGKCRDLPISMSQVMHVTQKIGSELHTNLTPLETADERIRRAGAPQR